MADHEQRVRDLAYRMWEDAGRPYGRADEFWHAASHHLADEGLPAAPGLTDGLPAEPEGPASEPQRPAAAKAAAAKKPAAARSRSAAPRA